QPRRASPSSGSCAVGSVAACRARSAELEALLDEVDDGAVLRLEAHDANSWHEVDVEDGLSAVAGEGGLADQQRVEPASRRGHAAQAHNLGAEREVEAAQG